MSGRTHALAPAGLVSVLFQGDPLVTLTAALAGLAPDIDEPESVIGQRCWLIAWWIKYVFGHRTVSHSLVMVALVALLGICVALPIPIIVALCVGVLSHVILDAYSGGVMLWWPSKTRWVLGRYPVYGVFDRVLMCGGVVLTIWMLIDRMQREMGLFTLGRMVDEGMDMSEMGERDVWRGVCYQARREHEQQLSLLASGEWPGTTMETKRVKVMMFRGDHCVWLSVGKESWVSAVEFYAEEVRRLGGVAIGAIMVGVMPEQEQRRIHFRPALLTVVTGIGICEGRRFDIAHRYAEEPKAIVFYGPVSADVEGEPKDTDWNVECGMEGVLIGPWPKRLPRSVSSSGEEITK